MANQTYPTRLRVFDVMTPWFWLVIFWRRQFGEPWLQIEVFPPAGWRKWWLHVWQREPEPDKRPAMAITQPSAHLYEGLPRG